MSYTSDWFKLHLRFFGRKVVNLTPAVSSWSWLFGLRGWNVVNILASFMGIIWKQFMSWTFLMGISQGFWNTAQRVFSLLVLLRRSNHIQPNSTYRSLVNFYPWLKMMEFEAGKSFQKYSWLFVVSIDWNFRGFSNQSSQLGKNLLVRLYYCSTFHGFFHPVLSHCFELPHSFSIMHPMTDPVTEVIVVTV